MAKKPVAYGDEFTSAIIAIWGQSQDLEQFERHLSNDTFQGEFLPQMLIGKIGSTIRTLAQMQLNLISYADMQEVRRKNKELSDKLMEGR